MTTFFFLQSNFFLGQSISKYLIKRLTILKSIVCAENVFLVKNIAKNNDSFLVISKTVKKSRKLFFQSAPNKNFFRRLTLREFD